MDSNDATHDKKWMGKKNHCSQQCCCKCSNTHGLVAMWIVSNEFKWIYFGIYLSLYRFHKHIKFIISGIRIPLIVPSKIKLNNHCHTQIHSSAFNEHNSRRMLEIIHIETIIIIVIIIILWSKFFFCARSSFPIKRYSPLRRTFSHVIYAYFFLSA